MIIRSSYRSLRIIQIIRLKYYVILKVCYYFKALAPSVNSEQKGKDSRNNIKTSVIHKYALTYKIDSVPKKQWCMFHIWGSRSLTLSPVWSSAMWQRVRCYRVSNVRKNLLLPSSEENEMLVSSEAKCTSQLLLRQSRKFLPDVKKAMYRVEYKASYVKGP